MVLPESELFLLRQIVEFSFEKRKMLKFEPIEIEFII